MLLFLSSCTRVDTGIPSNEEGSRTPGDAIERIGSAPPGPSEMQVLWETTTLPVFSLTFADDDWADALTAAIPADNCAERGYVPADLTFTNPATGAEEHWNDVAVRYRGHSALDTPNYSGNNRWGFKLDFEELAPGREFHGVERISLMGTEGDATLMRERLAFEVMRAAGVPAPYANHAWLEVNGEPLGLFPLVQEPDDGQFVADHFPGAVGHLYKVGGYCAGTHLGYEGEDYAAYDGYEAEAGTVDADKADDIVPTFTCLVGDSDEALRSCLGQEIDVDEWLAEIAADMYVTNVDGMAATAQNFMLFAPIGQPMVVYPYDMDLSWYTNENNLLATDIFNLRPIWEPSAPVLPLALRELWKDDYCAKMLEITAREETALPARIEALRTELAPAMDADPYLSAHKWDAAVDNLLEAAEERHAEVVAEAERCEIPPPPAPPEEPVDTGVPSDTGIPSDTERDSGMP